MWWNVAVCVPDLCSVELALEHRRHVGRRDVGGGMAVHRSGHEGVITGVTNTQQVAEFVRNGRTDGVGILV